MTKAPIILKLVHWFSLQISGLGNREYNRDLRHKRVKKYLGLNIRKKQLPETQKTEWSYQTRKVH